MEYPKLVVFNMVMTAAAFSELWNVFRRTASYFCKLFPDIINRDHPIFEISKRILMQRKAFTAIVAFDMDPERVSPVC